MSTAYSKRSRRLWILARAVQFLGVAAAVHGFTRWATIGQLVRAVRTPVSIEEDTQILSAFSYMFILVAAGVILLWSGVWLELWIAKQNLSPASSSIEEEQSET